MLGIPFLSTYIQRIVKVQAVADSVDWLNYYCTSVLLAFFALAISAKQYFGSPIQCWTPNEFKGGWDKYAENYCFVSNAYYVPFDEEIPRDLSHRQDQISYYRWVPVVLAVQALLFWLPNWIWNILHKQTAINPRCLLSEAQKSRKLHGADRDKEIGEIASFVSDTISNFSPDDKFGYRSRHPSGLNATFLYLALKLLYVLNCFGQLIILNRFLGGEFHSWAWQAVFDLFKGVDWGESKLFPRVIMFQCVIMLNMINEKLYFFLHFWFLFVGIVTLVNFFYYFAMLMIPRMRTNFVRQNINKHQQKLRGFGRRELHRFVQCRLRPDGVLLIHFIRQHVGGRFTYELLNELLRLHWLAQTSGATHHSRLGNINMVKGSSNTTTTAHFMGNGSDGVESTTNSPGRGDILTIGHQDENSFSRQNTYKPTAYGHALGYANMSMGINKSLSDAPVALHETQNFPIMHQNAFNSASLLRAISGTASPTNAFVPPKLAENQYSAPPTLQFVDGGDEKNQSKQHNQSMNTTPLMQPRRSKSPLVTGLGKRLLQSPQALNNMDSQTNKEDVTSNDENNTNSNSDV
ncbi:unnamed protein product [Meloidogyne enterolobii]|uniref:Uncharacterized protein n=1 Tax=Meloidogyne enterolobii TaxID=390850 RepID=A0ACB0Y270_MELEN